MNAGDWTAVGTLALAVVTLATLIATVLITMRDRRDADRRLLHQREQEQEAEAWAVQVVLAVRLAGSMIDWGPPEDKEAIERGAYANKLAATVSNHGEHPITRIEVQLSAGGDGDLMPPHETHYLPAPSESPSRAPVDNHASYGGVLTQGAAADFVSRQIAEDRINSPYAVVQWTDWRGTRWEHQKGKVRRIGPNAPERYRRRVASLAVSKRTTAFAMALALVIGGSIGFAWPAPGHPTAWTDIRAWVGFAVVVIGVAIALVLDGQLRELEQRARIPGFEPSEKTGSTRLTFGQGTLAW